jgi:hypothetical protein
MDIDIIWGKFIKDLNSQVEIRTAVIKRMAGLPFLYVDVKDKASKETIENAIKECAVKAMKGKRLNFEIFPVRQEQSLFVYRCRFLVPQEKMFCCGNFCVDCIRFR